MSEPAPKEERKKSGCLRWAVWSSLMLFLGPLLTVVGVLWFVLGSEDAGNLLLGRVQSDVLARLPGCVEYSGFSGELGSDINLSDVVIRERDADGGCTGPEALRAKSLHLEWDVWALANRFEVDVTALEIVEPVVHVRLRSAVDGKPPGLNWLDIFVDVTKPKKPKDLKEPQKGPAKLPRISAEKVTIVGDGRVLVLRDEQPLVDAQAIGLDASYELVRGRHYVRLHGLHVEPKVPVQLEPVDIAGRFELGAEAPHRAELQRLLAALQADDPAATLDGKTVFAIEAKPLSLKYPGIDSSLEVTGDLRLAGGPLFDFGIRSDGLQLDALHVIPKKDSEPQPLPLRGRVALDLTAKGGLDGLAVTGSVSQLDAEKPSASLHLDEVFVDVLGRPMMHRARLRLVDFDLERLIGVAKLPRKLSATVGWDGSGQSASTVLGHLDLRTGPLKAFGVKLAKHQLSADVALPRIEASHVTTLAPGVVKGSAVVDIEARTAVVEPTTITDLGLAQLAELSKGAVRAGVVQTASLGAEVSWAKPWGVAHATGELVATGLDFGAAAIDRAQLSWTDLQLTGDTKIPGVIGAVRAHLLGLQVKGVEQASEVTLHARPAGALAGFELVAKRGPEFTAALDGEIDWGGLPSIGLRGDRLMALASTLLLESREGAPPFELKTRSGSVQLDRFEVGLGDATLRAQASYVPGGEVRGNVRITELDLGLWRDLKPLLPESLRPKVERLALAGRLDLLEARIDGSLELPELSLRVDGRDLVVLDRPPLDASVGLTWLGDELAGQLGVTDLVTVQLGLVPARLRLDGQGELLTLLPDVDWDVSVGLEKQTLRALGNRLALPIPEQIEQGDYEGGLTWTGPLTAPSLRTSLSLSDVSAVGRSLNAKLGATLAGGRLELESSYLRTAKEGRILVFKGGADAALGRAMLARFGPPQSRPESVPPLSNLGLETLVNRLPMQLAHIVAPALQPLTGYLGGSMSLGGELDAPLATMDLELIGGRAGDQKLRSASVGVGVVDGILRTEIEVDAESGGSLVVGGQVTFPLSFVPFTPIPELLGRDDLDLAVVGDGFPLAVLVAFVPNTYDVGGALEAAGTVTGSLLDPRPDVALSIPDGRLCHEKTWICYETLRLETRIKPGRFDLTQLSFETYPRSRNPFATRAWVTTDQLAGGFKMDGHVLMDGWTPTKVRFDLDYDKMWLSSDEQLQVQLDGDTRVQGDWPALSVRGEIDLFQVLVDIGHEDIGRSVMNLRLPANLEVHRVETKRGPGERKPTFAERGTTGPKLADQILDQLDVDLGVHLKNNVKVKLAVGVAGQREEVQMLNTIGRVEPDLVLGGDVRVLFTDRKVRLEGRIETQRGSKLTALTKRFDMKDGSAVTLIGDPTASQLDLTAVHSTRYGDVTLKVTGSALKPTIDFSSEQYPDQADVMALLIAGKPLSELTAAQGAQTMSTVGAALGGFLVNKLGKYVPVDSLEIDLGDDVSSGSVEAGKAIGPYVYLLSRFRWGAEDDENIVEGQLEVQIPKTPLQVEVRFGDKLEGSVELVAKVLY